MINLFIILPESQKSTHWNLSNNEFQDENKIVAFVVELKAKIDAVKIENHEGYYDALNIKNFLRDFEDLVDYYPNPAFRLLRSVFKNWTNWREDILQYNNKVYLIYGQIIKNHAFCEVAERKLQSEAKKKQQNEEDKFLIINHYGHKLPNEFEISIEDAPIILWSRSTQEEICAWFAAERMPIRNFQVIPKHGENRQEEKYVRGELISPLRCSHAEAQEMLHTAIGDTINELFNHDQQRPDYFIVFKYENKNPQNMYHGFHVPLDSSQVPNHIRKVLMPKK